MSGTDRRPVLATLLTVLGCLAMLWVEWVLSPVYPVKSSAKALVFLGCAAAYVLASGDRTILRSFGRPEQGAMRLPLLLGGGVFLLLLGGYTLLSPWLDLSAISGNLQAKEGFTAATFPLAALYIIFGNSMLEELFFRGFAFLALYRSGYKKLAWTFSALAFALYHVSIMDGWFHPALLVLLTAGLACAGLLFNALDAKSQTIWPGWLVHMGANLAINTIALHLWGII